MMWETLSTWFWNERLWLPPNLTWNDMVLNNSDYPENYTLLYSFPLALGLSALRYILEKYWFGQIGQVLGIRNKRNKPIKFNLILERAYKNNLIEHDLIGLAKRVDWTQRQVERWLRQRRRIDHPTKLKKFSETLWKCCYYTTMFIFGLVILWNKTWLWNLDRCWDNYPFETISMDIKIYYVTSLGFYWSLCISQFWDVHRRDFWQMFLHHVLTILLLCLSWIGNLHRVGSLVLNLHDFADIFLELSKLTRYLKLQTISSLTFTFFIVTWIVTRDIIFPFWIIHSTLTKPPVFPAYFIINGLLILLFLLHIYWTYLLIKMAYRSILVGGMDKDIRSSSSSSDYLTHNETT